MTSLDLQPFSSLYHVPWGTLVVFRKKKKKRDNKLKNLKCMELVFSNSFVIGCLHRQRSEEINFESKQGYITNTLNELLRKLPSSRILKRWVFFFIISRELCGKHQALWRKRNDSCRARSLPLSQIVWFFLAKRGN